MIKCTNCFGTGSFNKKNKTEVCKKCNGTGIIETKPRKESRSNIPKLAGQVPYYQVFKDSTHVSINCCDVRIRFLGLKIDEPNLCKCGTVEVVRIYEKMIDITIVPLKYTKTILI